MQYINNPKNFSFEFLDRTNNFILLSKSQIEKSSTQKSGLRKEMFIKKLIRCCFNVDDVYLSKNGSYLDVKIGVDIIVKYQNKNLCFQLKSSKKDAEKFVSHDRYRNIGVLFFSFYKLQYLKLIKLLSLWLNIPVKSKFIKLLDKCTKLKGMILDSENKFFNRKETEILLLLNLIKVKKDLMYIL